jgi:RimJ/RimL family protein N-acetyltransferase
MEPATLWPLFEIAVRTPRLELRAVDQHLAFTLATLAAEGIHDPATMPFTEPWTDVASPELERSSLRHFWDAWARVRPEAWNLQLAVVVDGEVQGLQAVHTANFATLRTFDTGSWLGRRFQGRGIGREMRAAALHLMFAGFDAQEATTSAFADNPTSLAVTRSLGYEPNGVETSLRRTEPAELLRFRLPRERWATGRRDDIEIVGLTDACFDLLGLAPRQR